MKILFIFKSEGFMAPIGLCQISSIAKKAGHETYLSEIHQEDPIKRIALLRPDVVAYSSTTGEAKHYLSMNKIVKERFPDVFTVMGGPHPTFFPTMIENTTLDAICKGEGDEAFVDLLKTLESGKNISNLPNIIFQNKNSEEDCEIRNLVEDLDRLPFPDYDLIYENTNIGVYPLKSFITSRGCPYPCTYCFNHPWMKIYKGKGRFVRRHSVDYVIDDIERVRARWPLSCVKFQDDNFTYNADDWLEEFAEKYPKRVGLPFFILTRCDILTENLVKLLKHAGCRTISMSIETGDPNIRINLLKRNMSNNEIIRAHRLCKKYGIHTFTNNMIGLPMTNFSHDLESLELALKCHVDWAEFLQFHPYPGTQLSDMVIKLGMYTPAYEKMHTSFQHKSPLNCFTEKEKNMQMNLTLLGPVAVAIPSLKRIIVKYLLHLPPNKFFVFLYSLLKHFIIRRKIYVTKTSLWNSIKIMIESLRQDIFRHSEEKSSLER